MDSRAQELAAWCGQQLDIDTPVLKMVSGDASFRRYFRLKHRRGSLIAMDAPPEKENSLSFVQILQQWQAVGVAVPQLHAHNLSLGFLLLSDFGDQQLLGELASKGPAERNRWYCQAIDQLAAMQDANRDTAATLPPYDAALLDREMALFRDWLIDKKLGLTLGTHEAGMLEALFSRLKANALAQPCVAVHRDYHSRNLMCLADGSLGILDFQDAVYGPVTYDLVSLLRDCYVRWPAEQVSQWAHYYHQEVQARGVDVPDWETFYRDFEWMGMQRHLKASGIFARLALRDGKLAYLNDIPNTLRYLQEAASNYDETREFADWLDRVVIPQLAVQGLSCAP